MDDGHVNMPGGEVFYSPVEDSAEGVVEFASSRPCTTATRSWACGSSSSRAASSTRRRGSGEEFLLQTLDTDEGARRLGELGIGCNPGIQRFMKNVAFDEKINGTVHLAVGNSYTFIGGTNESSIHWDIVKDLRSDGRIYADGRLVQEDGRWRADLDSRRCLTPKPRRSRRRAGRCRRSGRGSPRSVRPPLSRWR